MTYFHNVKTVGEAKSLYRRLAKENHPDLNGYECTPIMQAINAEYHQVLEGFDGTTSVGSDGKEHTYRYNADIEQELMDKISELLGLRLDGCEIELVGTWIWVSGNTKPNKEALKSAGLTWHSKRQRWYWRRAGYRRQFNSKASFNDLRAMYGSRVFERDEAERGLSAA